MGDIIPCTHASPTTSCMDLWTLVAVKRAFDAFDIDGSGSIELAELLAVFKILGFRALNNTELTAKFKAVSGEGAASS